MIKNIRTTLIKDLVNMELEYSYPADLSNEKVGITKQEITQHFNSYSTEELKILWNDTFYGAIEEEANARNVTIETVISDWENGSKNN